MRLIATTLVALSLGGSAAHADPFIDVLAGIANPLADDDYTKAVDTSPKFGARIGSRTGWGALDIQLDFTPASVDDVDNGIADYDFTLTRFRALFGGRVEKKITSSASIYARMGVGLDIVRGHATGHFLGVALEVGPETDLGLGLEVGAGFMVNLGKISVGAVLSLPMAFHFDDDDPNDNTDFDFEYTGVDLDLLFALSVPL